MLDAKEAGLIDHIGLTSHGDPSLIRAAIERIPELETVMFPYNHVLAGKEGPEYDYDSVLDLAEEKGLGTLCIKGFAKGPWDEDLPEDERPYDTWYEPYDTREEIVDCLRFALSQGMTSIPNAGDPELVPLILEAAQDYEAMSEAEQERLREQAEDADSPVPAP
jgi:predicted aldo/keto reductase-like oxidoreductase